MKLKPGDRVIITQEQDGLMPGSIGIVRGWNARFKNYAVEITKGVWEIDFGEEYLHNCGGEVNNNMGYWISTHNLSKIQSTKEFFKELKNA